MMEAKFRDGTKEVKGPSLLTEIFKDAASALDRGALYAKITPVHKFAGKPGERCMCGKIAGDVIHRIP